MHKRARARGDIFVAEDYDAEGEGADAAAADAAATAAASAAAVAAVPINDDYGSIGDAGDDGRSSLGDDFHQAEATPPPDAATLATQQSAKVAVSALIGALLRIEAVATGRVFSTADRAELKRIIPEFHRALLTRKRQIGLQQRSTVSAISYISWIGTEHSATCQ